ncbi:PilZ domain-containing protein [Zestomonas carbonaria]|uniref:PilZ domain-containing protein n=1 Tax=Zestomonas carbonaria TaxID=2762745 RepID=A0A7U7EMD7_9GAMM|nr:PilZ domain-containing protein [Pseudomonas carbonaria]CAD5106760.1 hypothetical protein PSEWESI4_01027 [Pseudomonas carbonaria]
MSNQRQHPRTPMKCRIRISHPSFGELVAQTRDLSDGGVYVRHVDLLALPLGAEVTGQVQDLPIEAPILRMRVMRVDAEGVGLRFCSEEDERRYAAE